MKKPPKKITDPNVLAKVLYEKDFKPFGKWDSPGMYDCVRESWIRTAKHVIELAKRGRI